MYGIVVTNPSARPRVFIIPNFKLLFERINLGVLIDDKLQVNILRVDDADSVKLEATRIFIQKKTTVWDNDLSDGVSGSFNVPTGFYKIMATFYDEGKEIDTEFVSRVLYLNR